MFYANIKINNSKIAQNDLKSNHIMRILKFVVDLYETL